MQLGTYTKRCRSGKSSSTNRSVNPYFTIFIDLLTQLTFRTTSKHTEESVTKHEFYARLLNLLRNSNNATVNDRRFS